MKKIINIIVAVAIVAGLAACKKESPSAKCYFADVETLAPLGDEYECLSDGSYTPCFVAYDGTKVLPVDNDRHFITVEFLGGAGEYFVYAGMSAEKYGYEGWMYGFGAKKGTPAGQQGSVRVTYDDGELNFSKTFNLTAVQLSEYAFKVRLETAPGSKASVGASVGSDLKIALTAFNEKNEVEGDYFDVVGMVGNIEQYNETQMTYYAQYHVVKVSGGVATLDVVPSPDNMVDNYDECDYFMITSPYYPATYEYEDDILGGLMLANTCSKEEMDALISKKDVLPLYVLNSVVKVEVTVSDNDAPLTFKDMFADFESGDIVTVIDYSRMDEMIQKGVVFSRPGYPASWTAAASCWNTLPAGGGTANLYFCVTPGKFSNPYVELYAEDDRHCRYNFSQIVTADLDVKAGKMYTLKFAISKEDVVSAREFIPYIVIDGSIYDVSDSGYGMDNAQMIGDLLKTSSWVYLAKPGEPEDYTGIDVKGKVVLVDRGKITFTDKILNASDAGAAGIIVVNNQPGTLAMDLSSIEGNPKRIPAVAVAQEVGLYLLKHPSASFSLVYSL